MPSRVCNRRMSCRYAILLGRRVAWTGGWTIKRDLLFDPLVARHKTDDSTAVHWLGVMRSGGSTDRNDYRFVPQWLTLVVGLKIVTRSVEVRKRS